MAEYENEGLGVKFALPDTLTVRQQLLWRGGIALSGGSVFIRGWEGAKHLVEDWECEMIPDPLAFNLDDETDPAYADIVQYVANATYGHINDLEAVPKNV